MALGGGAFGRCLGYEAGALMNGISALIKKTAQSSLTLSQWEDTTTSLQHGREPSLNHAGILILDFQLGELWEVNFCCLKVTQSMVFCYSSLNRLRQ